LQPEILILRQLRSKIKISTSLYRRFSAASVKKLSASIYF